MCIKPEEKKINKKKTIFGSKRLKKQILISLIKFL